MKTLLRVLFLAAMTVAVAGTASAGLVPGAVGDINGDSAVNVLDIQAAIAQALETAPQVVQADIDGNSLVDIADVQNLINTSLGTGGLVQRIKGILSAPQDLLQRGVTLAAVSQDGEQVVVTVDSETGSFSIKLPIRKAWSFVFATLPDADGSQITAVLQFLAAGNVSTVLPLADLSQCDVLDLGTLNFDSVISVATDIRELLGHINKQEFLLDVDANGVPDFLDNLLNSLGLLTGLTCDSGAKGKMPAGFTSMCVDFEAVKTMISACIAGNLSDISDASLVDANDDGVADFLEPFLLCLRQGIATYLEQGGLPPPVDSVVNTMMALITQFLPAGLDDLHAPRLTDSSGDGIPDYISFGVGAMPIPPAQDANGDGIPDFLQHLPLPQGEGEPPAQTVPDISGMTLAGAQAAIAAAGLPLGAVGHQHSDTVAVDTVTAQRPQAGAAVPLNTQVFPVVSLGPAPQQLTPVPGVAGMTQANAEAAIAAAGLSVGLLGDQPDAVVPQGQVIRQYPTAGTMVLSGSPVNFLVSLGPLN